MNAAPAQPAPFLRRSLAWLLDGAAVAALATAIGWRWVAPAASAFAQAAHSLTDAVAQRLVAGMLDGAPLPVLARALLREPVLLAGAARVQDALWSLLLPWCAAYAALAFAWHVAGDLSPWRGSPGKRALGLRVEACGGGAPTPARAVLREAGSLLSWLTLNLGHLAALLPPRRQALHDRIAGTRVVYTSMPATGAAATGASRPSPSICRHAK